MFKAYGFIINNESTIGVVAGLAGQEKGVEKEVFFDDGSYGCSRMDGATDFELIEMDFTDEKFKKLLEMFKVGVFAPMNMILAVKNSKNEMGFLGCTDINNGTGVMYFENELSPGVSVKEEFFNSDAEDDEYWEEYVAYTDDGRMI